MFQAIKRYSLLLIVLVFIAFLIEIIFISLTRQCLLCFIQIDFIDTYLNIRHRKIVPNSRYIFCSVTQRSQLDMHVSVLHVYQSVCFPSNIQNFFFPPGWTLYDNTTSIFVERKITLSTKVLTRTGRSRQLILWRKYIYVCFT